MCCQNIHFLCIMSLKKSIRGTLLSEMLQTFGKAFSILYRQIQNMWHTLEFERSLNLPYFYEDSKITISFSNNVMR